MKVTIYFKDAVESVFCDVLEAGPDGCMFYVKCTDECYYYPVGNIDEVTIECTPTSPQDEQGAQNEGSVTIHQEPR